MLIAHKPLTDPEVLARMYELFRAIAHTSVDIHSWTTQVHTDRYRDWIQTGTSTEVFGLSQFKFSALASGSSDVIDSFVSRHNSRRIRFSQSEFVLSKIISNANTTPWCYLEDAELDSNDAVVISLPFAGNGSLYSDLDRLINDCTRLNIPVLVDISYVGISYGIKIDLCAPCITDVACSVSKPFATMLRHGIRFTRTRIDDAMQNTSDLGILARVNVVVASELMLDFDKDYISNKYSQKQKEVCQRLQLIPSNTVTLSTGNDVMHREFKRGNYIRVCITDELLS